MKYFLPFHKCFSCFVLISKDTLVTLGLMSMGIRRLETKEVSTLEHVLTLLAIQWIQYNIFREKVLGKHTQSYSLGIVKNKLDITWLSIKQKYYLDLISWLPLKWKTYSIIQRPLTLKVLSFVLLCFCVSFINKRPLGPWSVPINIYYTHNSKSWFPWAILHINMYFKSLMLNLIPFLIFSLIIVLFLHIRVT